MMPTDFLQRLWASPELRMSMLLIFFWTLCGIELFVALLEALHSARGINQALLASEERMAL